MRTSLCLAMVGVAMVLVCGLATAEEDIPRISVTGTAVARTIPDEALWNISISEFDETPLPPKDRSDEKLKAILALAKELEVAPEDIQSGSLSIRREYDRDEQGRQTTFKHFAVNRRVTLKQRDLTRFDEFASKLLTAGDIEVSFSLQSSKVHELRAETRLKAMRAAKEKADAMCREVGAAAGKPLRIEEHKGRRENTAFSNVSNLYYAAEDYDAVDLTQGTFAPGAIEVRITVYVDFEIL
jgi:uncharacterized protein